MSDTLVAVEPATPLQVEARSGEAAALNPEGNASANETPVTATAVVFTSLMVSREVAPGRITESAKSLYTVNGTADSVTVTPRVCRFCTLHCCAGPPK